MAHGDQATVVSIDITGKTEICEDYSRDELVRPSPPPPKNNYQWKQIKRQPFQKEAFEDEMAFPDSDVLEDFDKSENKTKKAAIRELWGMRDDSLKY
jgi:hypothetical protein